MKPIYQTFFRGLITFLPVAITVYVLYLFIRWVESIAMWAIRPLVGDFYMPGLGILIEPHQHSIGRRQCGRPYDNLPRHDVDRRDRYGTVDPGAELVESRMDRAVLIQEIH